MVTADRKRMIRTIFLVLAVLVVTGSEGHCLERADEEMIKSVQASEQALTQGKYGESIALADKIINSNHDSAARESARKQKRKAKKE